MTPFGLALRAIVAMGETATPAAAWLSSDRTSELLDNYRTSQARCVQCGAPLDFHRDGLNHSADCATARALFDDEQTALGNRSAA